MKKNRTIWLLLASAAMLLAVVGVTYGWIVQNAALATLMKILPPDTITIIPVKTDGQGIVELDLLDLDYQNGDTKDDKGKITVRRPICIRSSSPAHRLEIVHTTNLKDLTFNIYPATKSTTGDISLVMDNTPLDGAYKNLQADNSKLAKEDLLENYKDTKDVADVHAYPLYWLADQCHEKNHTEYPGRPVTSYEELALDPESKTEKQFYCTYYYLEISWLEETKETDLFYIIAQNVAD